ncbi:hypothetical protein HII31_13063, partial [Pseudocercospora fuligena]
MPATASAPEKTRRSRITAACAVCRAKRQKCSGEKGPAKDYLRALQDRLQDTERLLLGVLDRTSDAELLDVLQRESAFGGGPSHQTWTSAMSGSEYWSSHPLNRLDGIRAWERHRRSGEIANRQARPSIAPSIAESATTIPPGRLPSSTVADTAYETSPLDSMSNFGSGDQKDIDIYSQQYPSIPRRTEPWAAPEAVMARPDSRRYSQETREAGEALFSISNHHRTASHQSHPPPTQWSQPPSTQHPQTSVKPATPVPPQTGTTQFPKHLFWNTIQDAITVIVEGQVRHSGQHAPKATTVFMAREAAIRQPAHNNPRRWMPHGTWQARPQ